MKNLLGNLVHLPNELAFHLGRIVLFPVEHDMQANSYNVVWLSDDWLVTNFLFMFFCIWLCPSFVGHVAYFTT